MARKSKYTPDQRAALMKARQKKQEKYWEDRAQSRVLATDRQVDDIRKDSDRAYREARDAVRKEIDKFYRDFATAAGISEDEARQKLSRGELQDFKKELERKRKIIQEMIQKSPNNRKLQAYDTEFEKLSKVRELTRKEALEANVSAEIVKLGGKQEQQLNARSQNVVRTALWMNSADLSMLGDVDAKLGVGHPEQVKRAAKENWQHGDFSDKIWDDKEKLIREAREVIEGGFARNKGAYDMASDLMTRMNVSHSNALRLVRTEFNHLSNQAALAEYQAKGIKKYKFVSAIDSRTCDVCADLNGKVFNVADAKTGLNFPPIHPNCRSVTTPVIDWDDEDEWDYSGIELDDDELKKLGLTDDDVAEIDADTPMATDAPAPSLTVQQANQATEDTQSVQRRAEVAERIQKQTQDLEVDVRKQIERLDTIDDDIKRLEDINKRLDAQDVPMTPPRAAIEAENLERIDIALKEKELEVLRLQERAAKLDSSVPKPDHGEQDRLADEIDTAKTKREERQKKDLSDAEIIAQSLPKLKDALPVPKSAKDAEKPRTAIGKLWKRLKDGVEKVRERFEEWVRGFGERIRDAFVNFGDWFDDMFGMPQPAMAMAGGGNVRTNGILMTRGSGKGQSENLVPDDKYDPDVVKQKNRIIKHRKRIRGGQLFTDEEKKLLERWHISHPNRNPEDVIAIQMVGDRPVAVDIEGLRHMLAEHHDDLTTIFDNEDSIIDGLYHLLNHGQNLGRQRNYRKKGDSSPRIVYKGEWHGKTIAVSINVHEDRIFGANRPDRL